jgi:flagellar hook protein FlgE
VVRASSTSEDTVDLSQQAVDMLTAKNQFSVMTRVVDVTDQMQKSLLDILA